jgi:hypothetical protein
MSDNSKIVRLTSLMQQADSSNAAMREFEKALETLSKKELMLMTFANIMLVEKRSYGVVASDPDVIATFRSFAEHIGALEDRYEVNEALPNKIVDAALKELKDNDSVRLMFYPPSSAPSPLPIKQEEHDHD